MIYVILGSGSICIGLYVWGKIQKYKKEKAIEERDIAIKNLTVVEKKLSNMKNNVDQVLDYNTKDTKVKKEIDKSILILKSAKSKEDVKVEYEKIRNRIHDSIDSL